jgi:hypothetical protein
VISRREPDPGLRRRRWLTPTNTALVAILLGLGGFYLGVHDEKSQRASTASARVARPATARASAGITAGTVTRVDGDTIYVKESSGATVTVKLLSATTISKSSSVGSGSVRPGDSVAVQGTAGSDGTIKSTSITDSGGDSDATTSTASG